MRCKNHVIQIIYVIVFSIFINCCFINDSIVFANDDNQNSEAVRDISATRSSSTELVEVLSGPEISTKAFGLGAFAGLVGTVVCGVTITPGMIVAGIGLLFAMNVGVSAYALYKLFEKTVPEEKPDGKIVFHNNLDAITGTEHKVTVQPNYVADKLTYTVSTVGVSNGSYICLGTVNLKTVDSMTNNAYLFADITRPSGIYYPDQKVENATSTIIATIDPLAVNHPRGTVATWNSFQTIPNVPINRYMSVWTPQQPLARLGKIQIQKEKSSIQTGVDHWSSLVNAYNGNFNYIQNADNSIVYYPRTDANFVPVSFWIKKSEWMPDTIGANVYIRQSAENFKITEPAPEWNINIQDDIEIAPPPGWQYNPELPVKPDDMPMENIPRDPEWNIPDIVNPDITPEVPDSEIWLPKPVPDPEPSNPLDWVIKWLTDFWKMLRDLLIDVLKFLFVPSTWEDFVKDLDDTLNEKMPFIDQMNQIKDTIHFSGNERLVIPFIRGTVIMLPDYFENNRDVFRQMLSAILHVLFLMSLIRRFIPQMVITDSGK